MELMAHIVQRLFAADAHAPQAIEVGSSTSAPAAVGAVRTAGKTAGKAEVVAAKVCAASGNNADACAGAAAPDAACSGRGEC